MTFENMSHKGKIWTRLRNFMRCAFWVFWLSLLSFTIGVLVTWNAARGEQLAIYHDYRGTDLVITQPREGPLFPSLVISHLEPRSLALGGRLTWGQDIGHWRLSAFGGLSAMPGHQPDIGCSGFTGHFGVSVDYNISRNFSVSYALTHTSDPFRTYDSGYESHKFGLVWRY